MFRFLILILFFLPLWGADVVITVGASGANFTTLTTAISDSAVDVTAGNNAVIRLIDSVIEEEVDITGYTLNCDTLIFESQNIGPDNLSMVRGSISHLQNNVIVKIRWLHIRQGDVTGTNIYAGIWGDAATSDTLLFVEACVIDSIYTGLNDANCYGVGLGSMKGVVTNTWVHNIYKNNTQNREVVGIQLGGSGGWALYCTVDSIGNQGGSSNIRGIDMINNTNFTVKYCAVSGVSTEGTGNAREYHITAASPTADFDSCAYETTAPGASVYSVQFNPLTAYTDRSTGDYTLTASSPLIDEGNDISGQLFGFSGDIEGNTRSGSWDLGAHEYQGAGGGESPSAAVPGVRAFPGAEGYGAWTRGAYSSTSTPTIYKVTNLNDSGPGSFRDAVSGNDRVIVFDTSGTVNLLSQIVISADNLTFAFQTAPGDGFVLAGQHIRANNSINVIMRGATFRRGDNTVGDSFEFMTGLSKRWVFDHCTFEHGSDEGLSMSGNVDSVTVQWSIIAETFDNDGQSNHAYGAFIGSQEDDARVSAHHNLFAHNRRRMPKFLGEVTGASNKVNIDFINNVSTGWVNKLWHVGGQSDDNYLRLNLINNFAAPDGIEIYTDTLFEILFTGEIDYFLDGNIYEGNAVINSNNYAGVRIHPSATATTNQLSSAFSIPDSFHVTTTSAGEAYTEVLRYAGPVNRDSVTANIIANVNARTGAIIQTEESHPIGIPESWNPRKADTDTDGDGMPDWWEGVHGTDPAIADANGDIDGDGYHNIEEYINGPHFFPQFYTWEEVGGFVNNKKFNGFGGF